MFFSHTNHRHSVGSSPFSVIRHGAESNFKHCRLGFQYKFDFFFFFLLFLLFFLFFEGHGWRKWLDYGSNLPQQIEKQLRIAHSCSLMSYLELNVDLNITLLCLSGRRKNHLTAVADAQNWVLDKANISPLSSIPPADIFTVLFYRQRCAGPLLSAAPEIFAGQKSPWVTQYFLTWGNMSSTHRAGIMVRFTQQCTVLLYSQITSIDQ